MKVYFEDNAIQNAPFKIKASDKAIKAAQKHLLKPVIYDRYKKKAVCLNCQKEFRYTFDVSKRDSDIHVMPKFKKNDYVDCPLCKKTTKAQTHTSNFFAETNEMVFWCDNRGKAVKSALFNISYWYNSDMKWETVKDISAKMFVCHIASISEKRQIGFDTWGRRWIEQDKPHVYIGYINDGVNVDKEDLKKVLDKSFLKYSKDNIEYRNDASWILKELALRAKYPQTEYLSKAGLDDIVSRKLYGYRMGFRCNWKATNLSSFLRLSNQDIDKLKAWGYFDVEGIGLYKHLKKFYSKITKKQMNLVFDFPFERESNLRWTKNRDIYRIAKYINKELADHVPQCSHGIYTYTEGHALRMYKDYLDMIEKLDYPKNDYYLYPPNLSASHDRVAEEYQTMMDKEKAERRAKEQEKFNERLKILNRLIWSNDEYIIKPLASYEEFSNEGRNNRNCVASYYNRCFKGEKTVFVVRYKDKPDESLYTLEVSNNFKEIIQLYGKRNSRVPEEITEMVKAWLKICRRKLQRKKSTKATDKVDETAQVA